MFVSTADGGSGSLRQSEKGQYRCIDMWFYIVCLIQTWKSRNWRNFKKKNVLRLYYGDSQSQLCITLVRNLYMRYPNLWLGECVCIFVCDGRVCMMWVCSRLLKHRVRVGVLLVVSTALLISYFLEGAHQPVSLNIQHGLGYSQKPDPLHYLESVCSNYRTPPIHAVHWNNRTLCGLVELLGWSRCTLFSRPRHWSAHIHTLPGPFHRHGNTGRLWLWISGLPSATLSQRVRRLSMPNDH